MSTRTFAVTGASGFIGCALTRRLLDEGHVVHALVRPASARRLRLDRLAGPRLRVLEADIEHPASVNGAFDNVDVVIHTAARALVHGTRAQFMRANVEGTENVLAAAERSRVRRFVFISSTDVYGYVREHGIDETCPVKETGLAYADSKIAAEAVVRRFATRGLPCTIVRPATVVGPGSVVVEETVRFLEGSRTYIDRGRANAGLCAVDNLVDALLVVSEHPDAVGNAYNVTDNLPVTFRTWADDVARVIGVRPATRSIPFWAAVPAAFASECWNLAVHGSQRPAALPVHIVKLLGQSQDFNTERLRRLGWTPRVSYEHVLETVAADLHGRHNGRRH